MNTEVPRSRYHTAYHLGRTCNRLWWHAQQALLLSGNRTLRDHRDKHRKELDSCLREVVGLLHECHDAPPELVASRLRDAEHRLSEIVNQSDRVFELIEGARQEFQRREYEDDARARICDQLVRSEIEPIAVPLFDFIADQQTEKYSPYFVLGRRIDEGLRRPDVSRFMNDDLVTPRLVVHDPPLNEAELIEGTWEIGGESEVSSDYELVQRQVGDGELYPQPLWPIEIEAIWRRLGHEPVPLTAVLRRLSERMAPTDLSSLVKELDKLVVDRLSKLAERDPPVSFKYGPVECKAVDVEAAIAAGKRHTVQRRLWSLDNLDGTLWYRDDNNGGYLRQFYFLHEQDYKAVLKRLEENK